MQRRAAVSFQWKTASKRSEEDVQEDFAVKFSVENCFIVPKQRRKNAVVLAAEVVDSLLWVERHSGTVTGLPPKERLQKRSVQLLFCFPAGTVNFLLLRHENLDNKPSYVHVSIGKNTVT